jgi:hypothetical protein
MAKGEDAMATIPRVFAADHTVPHSIRINQVDDLLKLQKAAQRISSILDLDELVDKVVNDVARSFGCVDADIYLQPKNAGNWCWRARMAAPAALSTAITIA